MKKILLIAAVALCAMGCCKKAKCHEGKCCDKPAVECCQKQSARRKILAARQSAQRQNHAKKQILAAKLNAQKLQ